MRLARTVQFEEGFQEVRSTRVKGLSVPFKNKENQNYFLYSDKITAVTSRNSVQTLDELDFDKKAEETKQNQKSILQQSKSIDKQQLTINTQISKALQEFSQLEEEIIKKYCQSTSNKKYQIQIKGMIDEINRELHNCKKKLISNLYNSLKKYFTSKSKKQEKLTLDNIESSKSILTQHNLKQNLQLQNKTVDKFISEKLTLMKQNNKKYIQKENQNLKAELGKLKQTFQSLVSQKDSIITNLQNEITNLKSQLEICQAKLNNHIKQTLALQISQSVQTETQDVQPQIENIEVNEEPLTSKFSKEFQQKCLNYAFDEISDTSSDTAFSLQESPDKHQKPEGKHFIQTLEDLTPQSQEQQENLQRVLSKNNRLQSISERNSSSEH